MILSHTFHTVPSPPGGDCEPPLKRSCSIRQHIRCWSQTFLFCIITASFSVLVLKARCRNDTAGRCAPPLWAFYSNKRHVFLFMEVIMCYRCYFDTSKHWKQHLCKSVFNSCHDRLLLITSERKGTDLICNLEFYSPLSPTLWCSQWFHFCHHVYWKKTNKNHFRW